MILGGENDKWVLRYCRRGMADLKAAFEGYSKHDWIGNAKKAESELRILQVKYERFISDQPI